MRKINKKGELTTKNLVTIIVLITSFAIILFLLFRLNLGETTDKEICHNSVVLASKGKGILGGLDCKTNYICISGGGKCEGINPTKTVKVDPNNKEEIMKSIADEMADCWWMFGEGKLDYLKADGKYHCAICSMTKFDNLIQDEVEEISYLEFYEYLRDTGKSNTETYLKYLYNVLDINSVKKLNKKIKIVDEKILTSEKFAIITGLNPNSDLLMEDFKIYPYFVKSDEVMTKTDCEVFDLTKA